MVKPILPLLDYAINYEYITKELCENKAQPETGCNGKCHLKKELAEASEDETPISNEKKSSHSEIEILFFNDISELTFKTIATINRNIVASHYSNFYNSVYTNAVFHPPLV